MWTRQIYHLLFLIVALSALFFMPPLTGELGGKPSSTWFWISIGVPVLHQLYVLLCWRLQLHYKSLTRLWGPIGFKLYAFFFFVLFLSRFFALWILALSNANSMTLADEIRFPLIIVFAFLAGYTMYSVARYFGFPRATGADHFFEEYRTLPFVRKGMFKYSSNSMYTYGFLGTYLFGLAYLSWGALVSAMFAHAYIWVHYFCTEKPDMDLIYRKPPGLPGNFSRLQ